MSAHERSPKAPYDCRACGACCVNRPSNVRAKFADYVEVKREDALFRDKSLLKKLTVLNDRQERHMVLVGDEQRCVALTGPLGVDVTCTIYALRPSGCRKVEPGDDECQKARKLHGISARS